MFAAFRWRRHEKCSRLLHSRFVQLAKNRLKRSFRPCWPATISVDYRINPIGSRGCVLILQFRNGLIRMTAFQSAQSTTVPSCSVTVNFSTVVSGESCTSTG